MYTFRMEQPTFNSINKLNIYYKALNAKMKEIESKLNGEVQNDNASEQN